MDIDRAFVRLAEGLVHYRYTRAASKTSHLPLYLAHAGPVSSASLTPLILNLSGDRLVIAPDTLGYGDSAPPEPEKPDLLYYADSVARILDKLKIDKIDFYGTHTGAHIGCEFALAHPDRVRKLIFDGMGVYEGKVREDYLEYYAPHKMPDEYGSQFNWAWHFLRDQSFFFPHFKKTPEHRLNGGVMSPEMLHDFTIDVLKAIRTYHKGYEAVFRHETLDRMSQINHPLLLVAMSWDPLKAHIDRIHNKIPKALKTLLGPGQDFDDLAVTIETFLAP